MVSTGVHAQEPSMNSGLYMDISAGESKAHLDNARISQNLLGAGTTTVNAVSSDQKGRGYKAFVGFPMNSNWAVETAYFDLARFGFDATTSPAGSLPG